MPWETTHSRLIDDMRQRGVAGRRVLEVMAHIPRDVFVDEEVRHRSFEDEALPIGQGQTISQPSVVAAMSDALEIEPGARVLEVGTGSGYQAAVLADLAGPHGLVVTVERQPALAARARRVLEFLGYGWVQVVDGDGTLGWPSEAPYDAILVAAASPAIPQPLVDQLAPGGRLVAPVGGRDDQELVLVTRSAGGALRERAIGPVRFVPLVGEYGWPGGEPQPA